MEILNYYLIKFIDAAGGERKAQEESIHVHILLISQYLKEEAHRQI